jgi:AcrR family transcriptional regulator
MVAETDFRSRVAQEKRARMRARLLDATLNVYGAAGRGGSVVIDDIIQEAGVSRGTFYKYFNSVEEAVAELGRDMAQDMLASMTALVEKLQDPADRMAASPLMPLVRAMMQPRWAAFPPRVDYVEFLHPGSIAGGIVGHELALAKQAGILQFDESQAAADFIVGATAEGIARLAKSGGDIGYAKELSRMILAGLGMAPDRAATAVEAAWRMLSAQAPNLTWWREEN